MKKIFTNLRTSYVQNRQMRRALPVAAAIIGSRVLAQAQGCNGEVNFDEIASEAIHLTNSLKKQIYSNETK